jgi:hypothetical protein
MLARNDAAVKSLRAPRVPERLKLHRTVRHAREGIQEAVPSMSARRSRRSATCCGLPQAS